MKKKLPTIKIPSLTKTDADKNETTNTENLKPNSAFGVRHVQCLLLFLCLTMAYAMRVNMSVAIVAMTETNSTHHDFPIYNWKEEKSYVLSSFFWGYVITQVPGGQLAQRYGPKLMLLITVTICALLNILTPLMASLGGWQLTCAARVIQGLCQGVIFPSCHTALSRWAPVEERSRLVTWCYSGSQFGTVIMLGTSGFIASSVLGWPSIFYVSGGAGLVWAVLWLVLGANSPSDSKAISPEERKFIETSLGQNENDEKVHMSTPWFKILTSMPFLSVLIVHCGHNWGFWTLLTEMPTYISKVLHQDIKSNALFSALPYLAMWLLCYFFSFCADIVAKRQILSLVASRKLFNTIGHWIPMCALIGLAYTTAEQFNLAIGLLTIAVGINAATYCGFQVSHIDLAPNHAGTLMGLTNCAANIISIIAPLIVGVVVTDEENVTEWRIVFFISAAIYFLGNLIFVIFGKASKQPWNDPPSTNTHSA